MRVTVTNLAPARGLRLAPIWRPHHTVAAPAPWDAPELYQSACFINRPGTGIVVESRDPGGNPRNRKYTALLTDLDVEAAEVSYGRFLQREWSVPNDRPRGMDAFRGEDTCATDMPIAALRGRPTHLAQGESIACTLVLDHLPQWDWQQLEPELEQACQRLAPVTWQRTMTQHRDAIRQWSSAWQVHTPDAALNQYLNDWLPLQLRWVGLLDRGWPTGLRGTRDASQDYSAITRIAPQQGRAMLCDVLACQRLDGSFPRQFSTAGPDGTHDLRDYVDSGCWVFELLYDYLRYSGDLALLDQPLRWLDSTGTATVRDHARQLLAYYLSSANRGPHGLIKIRGGDWNDSLNTVGLEGRGESVMVSCHVIHLLRLAGEFLPEQDYRPQSEALRTALRTHALNHKGFLNGAFSDSGHWLFSERDPDGARRVNSPVNSFGIIAGVFEPEELPAVLAAIDGLKGPCGYRLFHPPLGRPPIEQAGRMGAGDLYPGAGENGTVYNHGSQGFLMRALTTIGEGDRALDVLKWALPYDQERHPLRITKTEPYGIVNHWSEVHGKVGEGGAPFLSGTISTLFRAFYEGLLGIRPTLTTLTIRPCLPSAWDNVQCRCRFRDTALVIDYERTRQPGKHAPAVSLLLNGKPVAGISIPIEALKTDSENTVRVTIAGWKAF